MVVVVVVVVVVEVVAMVVEDVLVMGETHAISRATTKDLSRYYTNISMSSTTNGLLFESLTDAKFTLKLENTSDLITILI